MSRVILAHERQQQRVAIARALANDPPILVADEPTGNLDSKTANAIFQLFTDLVKKEEKTILMVTHDADLAARVTRTIVIADGTLAFLDVKTGEQLGPGAIAAQLADFSEWQIETDDLTELSIVYLQIGDQVDITFDALPEVEMLGKVTRIRPIGENKQGDITYTVIVTPDKQDGRLRWNMTSTTVIKTSE